MARSALRIIAWAALSIGSQTLGAAQTTVPQDAFAVSALQRRLQDAGCYAGALDGQPSPALDAAIHACPDQDPVLRIETGMHVAAINQIDVDATCGLLVTGSDDKTARLWSTRDASLVRTFRPPIGPGAEGKIRGAAIAPDGRFVAVGGWDPHARTTSEYHVYVFDAASGHLVARLGDFGDVILHIAFSPDGHWLAATGAGTQGLRVYDTTNWTELGSDKSYRGDAYGLAFGPDGRLYTAASDRLLRRYAAGPSFKKQTQASIKTAAFPQSLDVDPRGAYVAVGFLDSGRIAVFDTARLRLRFATPAVANGTVGVVAWSRDGTRLMAGGSFQYPITKDRPMALMAFDRNGHPIGAPINVANNSITSVRTCGSGTYVAAEERGFGLVDPAGNVGWRPTTAPDLRDKTGDALAVSPDGMRVRFGLAYGNADPVLFDLGAGTLETTTQPSPDLATPIVDGPISGWQNGLTPAYDGRPMNLEHLGIARSLAILPDRAGFILGSAFRLWAFGPNANQLWSLSGPGDAWGVDVTADSRIVVAAFGDGTIRWHRASDGKELLALFVEVTSKRWIAWTPTGYYMASPGGEDLIGWHVNRGWDQPADFFPASRFRARFNRPDIVRLVLTTLDEDAAVTKANQTARRHQETKPLITTLPPLIRIVDPAGGSQVQTPGVSIAYAWRSPSGQPVDRIDVQIDGRTTKDVALPVRPSAPQAEVSGSVAVDLRSHDSVVGLIAWSGDMASEVASVKLVWTGAPLAASQDRKLYALIVGVSDYASKDMTLAFPSKDARDFATTLEQQKGAYYRDVETRVLVDRAVTRASIIDGLEWLEQTVTRPEDVGVLFLAGHGMTDEKQMYWFLPSDATADDVRAKGVSQDEMRRSLQSLSGKVLWFLDTCHAGSAATPPVDITSLVNTVTAPENGGIVTFASSTGKELSEERPEWNNGAFTKAIREGIDQGKADLFRDGTISTSQLDAFLEKRVQELTGDKQHPVMARPPQEPDFTIVQVRPN